MTKLSKFTIQENEFFEIEETNNFKLLSLLLKTNNFNQQGESEYSARTIMVIYDTIEKIKSLDINFNLINYFIDNNKEDILYERLLVVYLLKENDANESKNLLIKNVKIIKSSLNKLKSYLDIISLFFPNKYYREINKMTEVIKNIKISTIKSYLNKYSSDYNKYITKLRDDIEMIGKRSESYFFITIYNDVRKNNKLDDENCFKKANQKFEKMKDIFSKNKLVDSNKIVEMCLRPFENREEELQKEIDIDIELLKLQTVKDKFELYKDLLLLLKRRKIINIALACQVFINHLRLIKTDFYKDLDKIIKELQISKTKKIKKSADILSKYEIDINNIKEEYLVIILLFKNQSKSIDFLLNTSIEDCRILQELPGLFENGFLSVGDILDLENCINFMKKFGNSENLGKMKDFDFITKFRREIKKNKNICLYFTKYINNFALLKDMMTNGLDRAEISKNKIFFILEKSEIKISNLTDSFFKCLYYEPNRKKNNELTPIVLSLQDLFDLRDRAQLNRNMIFNDENKNMKEKENIILINKKFIELVSEINNLYGLLQEIYWKGFTQEVIIEINIEKSNIVYNIEKKDYNNFNEIINLIKEKLDKIKESQTLGYKNSKLIRYFFGLQFNYFYKILNEKKKNNLNKLMPFLNYVTNELINVNLEYFNYKKTKNEYQDIITNCQRYLTEILKKNKLSYEAIYRNSIIYKKEKLGKYKGIYIYLSQNLEKDLFQIYNYLTANNPSAQNILLCNNDTTNEEIVAFLYRAILCEFNSCFIVGGIETLTFDKKNNFFNLINNLYVDNYKKMRSCLIILYTNKSSDIYKWLELEKTIKKLDLIENDYKNEIYNGKDIEIIYSDKSGVGKSTQIQLDILNRGKQYIYFPFGGVLNRNQILERLKKLELNDNSVIHLDLYDTDQISLMMEFLFSILITKLYGKNENIFYLSKKIEIKIEIPNSFIDFFSKFPILNLFPKKMLSINNLAPLIISTDLNSNIQILCNYLKDLKENNLNKRDLYFPGITPEIVKEKIKILVGEKPTEIVTAVNPSVLSQEECQNLIFEKINIEKPTYYQINSFINILAEQIKQFSMNYYLNCRQLSLVKLSNIRTFIVENFIKLTKHFTEGAYTDLLKRQEITYNNLEKYNEEKDLKKAINNLANNNNLKKVVSFNKIDPSLLFFHEGTGQSFSIITNKYKNDKEYIDLLALQNSQSRTKNDIIKELPNYKKYSQKQFLKELKDILDITNPIEKDEKNSKISLEEITGNYVFTADNFAKMALILLRIRSNIPVIMMGETGCGKTSLIRKLAEMKNDGNADKMKILNIHAGTTDQDIIDFIEKKVNNEAKELTLKELERKKECKKKGLKFIEKKIWVFLDEINTCKSMGLISELMCKHKCQGNILYPNIVFIAACNPYRQREKKEKENFGLNINQAHQQKKLLNDKEIDDIRRAQNSNLVYNVNPLPHSLLNFVFDFGYLTSEDEENYIKCMIKESIEKKFNENRGNYKDSDLKKLLELTKDMIVISQNFIRKHNDVSSVSLREIRRFNILYEFFYDFIKIMRKNEKKHINNIPLGYHFISFEGIKEFDIHLSAINLSLFVCYYMRITNKNLRMELYERLNDKISSYGDFFTCRDFLELPLYEEKFIADNIQIEKGIAKNKALLENIFSLFVAINNKIPIFIVGKPGCSKSLSVQLISKAMRGNLSNNYFFKQFP